MELFTNQPLFSIGFCCFHFKSLWGRPGPGELCFPFICYHLMTNGTFWDHLGRDRSKSSGNMNTLHCIFHPGKGNLSQLCAKLTGVFSFFSFSGVQWVPSISVCRRDLLRDKDFVSLWSTPRKAAEPWQRIQTFRGFSLHNHHISCPSLHYLFCVQLPVHLLSRAMPSYKHPIAAHSLSFQPLLQLWNRFQVQLSQSLKLSKSQFLKS